MIVMNNVPSLTEVNKYIIKKDTIKKILQNKVPHIENIKKYQLFLLINQNKNPEKIFIADVAANKST